LGLAVDVAAAAFPTGRADLIVDAAFVDLAALVLKVANVLLERLDERAEEALADALVSVRLDLANAAEHLAALDERVAVVRVLGEVAARLQEHAAERARAHHARELRLHLRLVPLWGRDRGRVSHKKGQKRRRKQWMWAHWR